MAKDNLPTNSLAAEELKKCNRDLSRFYELEQKKTKELEEALQKALFGRVGLRDN